MFLHDEKDVGLVPSEDRPMARHTALGWQGTQDSGIGSKQEIHLAGDGHQELRFDAERIQLQW